MLEKNGNGIILSGWGSQNNPTGNITDIAATICARYFKGPYNFGTIMVIEIEKDTERNK